MPKVSSNAKNGKIAAAAEPENRTKDEPQVEEKEKQGSGIAVNPLMQRLTPEMLSAPYPVELRNGRTVNSFDFALTKLDQTIAIPLGLDTEDEWLAFARMLFSYRQRQEEQRVEEQANKLLEDLKQKPAMLQRLVQRLNAELVASQGTPAPGSAFNEDYGLRLPPDVARYS